MRQKLMINIMDLMPGTKVRLVDGATAEVVSNPRDGVWVRLRYLTAPANPTQVDTEELVFAESIVELA
jgi:hypothetical protein